MDVAAGATTPNLPETAEALIQKALTAAEDGHHAQAASLFTDAFEVAPSSQLALEGVKTALNQLHGAPRPIEIN